MDWARNPIDPEEPRVASYACPTATSVGTAQSRKPCRQAGAARPRASCHTGIKGYGCFAGLVRTPATTARNRRSQSERATAELRALLSCAATLHLTGRMEPEEVSVARDFWILRPDRLGFQGNLSVSEKLPTQLPPNCGNSAFTLILTLVPDFILNEVCPAAPSRLPSRARKRYREPSFGPIIANQAGSKFIDRVAPDGSFHSSFADGECGWK